MYQQENHMYETTPSDTAIFRAPASRRLGSLGESDIDIDDPELDISTRPFDADVLRQMVDLANKMTLLTPATSKSGRGTWLAWVVCQRLDCSSTKLFSSA